MRLVPANPLQCLALISTWETMPREFLHLGRTLRRLVRDLRLKLNYFGGRGGMPRCMAVKMKGNRSSELCKLTERNWILTKRKMLCGNQNRHETTTP